MHRLRLCCIAGALILAVAIVAIPPAVAQAGSPFDLVSDGQFVYGPNVGDFDVASFLRNADSPLAPYAGVIDQWCSYASVNPRLVLALLALRPELAPAGPDFEQHLEPLVMGLATDFYAHLYTRGARRDRYPELARRDAPTLRLAGGETVSVPAGVSSGTYAVLSRLAPLSTRAQWDALFPSPGVSDRRAGSFAQTYRSLFPDDDPLDPSNQINAAGPPPASLLQLPYPVGERWWFNGPHNWSGGGYGPPYSSIDFAVDGTCAAPPANAWAVAAAGGTASHPYGATCLIRIDHGGGWITSYYHLLNARASGDIDRNDPVGTIGCETCIGGFATAPHVHFSLLYNGAYTDLEGTRLSGWIVHPGAGTYTTGYLERNGQRKIPYDYIYNDGILLPADANPPQANWILPAGGAVITASVLSLQAAATDDLSGVNRVKFSAMWAGAWRDLAVVTAPPYVYYWNMCDAGVPDGSIELGLEAWDNAGNHYVYSLTQPNLRVSKSYTCSPAWHVEYFGDDDLHSRCAESWESGAYIFKDWGASAPAAGCNAGAFSARFTRQLPFDSGTYTFTLQSDAGARLLLDGQVVIDAWDAGAGQAAQSVVAGAHEVRIEYRHQAGRARLEAWWQGPTALPASGRDPDQWWAEYFGNRELWGQPALAQNDGFGNVSHMWEAGSPGYGLPADSFSSRLQRRLAFACGRYNFHIISDDGVRFWIDGIQRLNRWLDGSYTYDVLVDLAAGEHDLLLEHYENAGVATLILEWNLDAGCPTPTPTRTLTPTVTPTSIPTTTATPSATPTTTATTSPPATETPTITPSPTNSVTSTPTAATPAGTSTATPTPTATAPAPPIPQPLQPPDGSVFRAGETIRLCWQATGEEYAGTIWGGPLGVLSFGWQAETCYQPAALPAGYAYAWHVKARAAGAESAWSLARTFTIQPAQSYLPLIWK